jgi:hypothetical protein
MAAMVATAMDWGDSIIWRRVWGLSLASWAFIIAGMSAFVGLLWDGAWHASWGRDTFFIPPHNMMYGGITLAMAMAFGMVVVLVRHAPEKDFVRIGPLQAPLGIWISIAGMVLMFSSAAYDDWWHTNIGHVEGDIVLWSPPHFLGLIGALTTLSGAVLFVLREVPIPTRADGKPLWVWERFDIPSLALLLVFSYLSFMIAAISMDRYVIYDKLRFDGSVYPILALLFGPGLLVLAQRVTNRAGAATFAVALGFFLNAMVAFFVRDLFGFPKAAGLPIMGLVSAVLLDLAFKRFGRGYKWLLVIGPVFVLVFYATEFLWAWYLTRYPWWPIEKTLYMIPVGMVVGTLSMLVGAWVAEALDRAGFIKHINFRQVS